MRIFTIIMMLILAGAEVDLFVPSFSQLQKIFNLTAFQLELSVSLNMIAHCVTALLVGALGDKYGNKKVIKISLLIFIGGSIFCVFTTNYNLLLVGRVFQGIGISGPAVLAYVLVSDIYHGEKTVSVMGIVNGTSAIAMAFAPVIGSYVNLFFDWQGNFVILLFLGIISLILTSFYLPETDINRNKKISIKEYMPILGSAKAILYILAIAFAMQSYWVFIAMSPILYINDLGVSLKNFGLYQGSIAATFAFGSISSGYFFKKYGQLNCLIISAIFSGIFFIGIVLLVYFRVNNPLLITFVMLFEAIGMVYPINTFCILSLTAVKNAKAKIGALSVAGRLLVSAISVEIASYYYNKSFVSIGTAIYTTLLISVVCLYILIKKYNILSELNNNTKNN